MRTPASLKKYLTPDQMKLYSLIWSRFVASQMTPAVYDTARLTLNKMELLTEQTGRK